MRQPTVSVIIPTHRYDSWLDEAVMSALASRDVDIEVVVVVNGAQRTTERSWEIDDRVRLIHEPEPLGPTRAMIRGLDAARADFIARLDADDRMRPERLAAQVAYLRAHPDVPLVGSAVGRILEDGSPAGSIRLPVGPDVRTALVLQNTVPHSSVMLRRNMLDAAGGYDARLDQMEDYDVILRLAQMGPIAVLEQELTDYRLHAGQISRGARPRGPHIDQTIRQRKGLGRTLGMNPIGVWARNLVWRTVQFTRYYGVTRPGHAR